MLGSVFTKTIRDRWVGWAIAVATLASFLWMAMWAYRKIDLGIYTSLPDVYRALLNISKDADVASLSISALVTTYGAMTIAAMAFSMGGAAIAGEERAGTIGLLLGNPVGRVRVLLEKAAAMVVLTTLGSVAMYASIIGIASGLEVSIRGMHPGALVLHMGALSLFFGFLSLAIGAWTGSRGAASGTSTGLMVLSFLAAGLLPLFEWGKTWVKVFPWYYFNGSNPLINGIEWPHVAGLAGASALLAALAVAGVRRRDLKLQSVRSTLLDRIRANPTVDRYLGKLIGSARVGSIWVKTASDHQGLLSICAYYTFLVQGVMLGPLYDAMPKEAIRAISKMPSAMIALVGGGDLGTPEGFYQLETFGMMAPIVIGIVTVAVGAGALAGEESRRTMGLLLANPVSRARVVAEKAWTMTLYSFVLGLVTFVGVALGSRLGDLGISTWNIAATCLLASLVGLIFGALALALSAATGRMGIAVYAAVGAGLGTHLMNGFALLDEDLVGLAKWSPFHYYLGNDPLKNGIDWSNAAVLVALCTALIAAAFPLFQRRDIRQQG